MMLLRIFSNTYKRGGLKLRDKEAEHRGGRTQVGGTLFPNLNLMVGRIITLLQYAQGFRERRVLSYE